MDENNTALVSVGDDLLNLNFSVSKLRNADSEEIISRFEKVFDKKRELALRWLCYARDIRSGLGERRLCRIILRFLAKRHPECLTQNLLTSIAEKFGRWDDILQLLNINDTVNQVLIPLVNRYLTEDEAQAIRGSSDMMSNLCKWMPSINTSSEATRILASQWAFALNMTHSMYRKKLSFLRSHLKVVEKKMSAKQWDSIQYDEIPTTAIKKYNKSFMRHDIERYEMYRKRGRGDSRQCYRNLHDIYADAALCASYAKPDRFGHNEPMDHLEAIWDKFIATTDYVPGIIKSFNDELQPLLQYCPLDVVNTWAIPEHRTIGVINVFDDMFNPLLRYCPLDMACAWAVYFGDTNTSLTFVRNLSTFNGELVSYTNDLKDKANIGKYVKMNRRNCDFNLDILFDDLLDTAVTEEVDKNEMPNKILIMTDDTSSHRINKMTQCLSQMKQKYQEHGYELPILIWWNLLEEPDDIPFTKIDTGYLLKGYNQVIADMLMHDFVDSSEWLANKLMSERYNLNQSIKWDSQSVRSIDLEVLKTDKRHEARLLRRVDKINKSDINE